MSASYSSDDFTLDEDTAKKLFADIRHCDFENISPRINKLGGELIINKLRSPYGTSKQRIWMAISWRNKMSTAIERKLFIDKLEKEFKPNFDLTNDCGCNMIHDLCWHNDSVDNKTSITLLKYFINQSKCISKNAFIQTDKNDRTPLHYAAAFNKIECVILLLPYYTKNDLIKLTDKTGKTIMEYAEKYPQIHQLLLSYDRRFDNSSDDEYHDEKYETIKIKERKLIRSAFSQIGKVISRFNAIIYGKSIETDDNKKHLRGLKLNNKQLKTSYCLENQTLQFIFHCYNNDKNIEWKQPIGFWVTYNILDEQIIENMNNVSKNAVISYEIGALLIDRYNDEPLFIKGVMNALRQSNAIEQPFHIVIKTNVSKNNTSETRQCLSDITGFAKGLALPIKAIVPSYKKLYPKQIYEKYDNDCKFDMVKDIKGQFSYFGYFSDLEIQITDRLTIIIPSNAREYDFKIGIYSINNQCPNDIRFQILYSDKYAEKTNKKPIKIKWILDKNYTYNKNEWNKKQQLFKIYFHIALIDIWCTGNDKQIKIINNGHPKYDTNNNNYYIEGEIYGAYDIHIREQINFYDQYIDKFCFDYQLNEDFSNPSNIKLDSVEHGGRAYYQPKGWKIYGINVNKNNENNLTNMGCIGFHCTSLSLLPSILRDGLVIPGTTLSSCGYRLPIPKGHITVDKIDGIDDNDFTNNVFASPSINYCSYPSYCKSFKLSNNNKYNKKYAHLALKVYVKPDAIRVNKQTIGWEKAITKIDPNYENNVLEWRIRDPKDVIIAGLCIYESDIKNYDVWITKEQMRDNNNKLHQVRDVFELKNVFKISIIDKTDDDNVSEIELERYLLPTVKVEQLKKMYLQQLKDKKTNINDLLLFNDSNDIDEEIDMNNDKTLYHYGISKQQNTKIYATFPDKMCSICLFSIRKKELIELECCGLSLHNDCLKNFIKSKSIVPGQKISLQQLSCLMCRKQMTNKTVRHLFTSIDLLYEKLTNIALNQLKYDNIHNHKQIIDKNSEFYGKPLQFAMKQYSFNICFKCKEPYCSGSNNCIDDMQQRENIKSEQHLCLWCTPPITGAKNELESILKSMHGHGIWLCPNDHIYFIGNCTSTNGTSKCQQCGATIGNKVGTKSHTAATGNRRVGKIDKNGKIVADNPYSGATEGMSGLDLITYMYQMSSSIR